ncbi:nucleoid occlusion protein [Barrientosiimonas marina]
MNRIFGMGDKNEETTPMEENYQADEVIELSTDNIVPNRFQPRAVFNDERLQELAQTIHTHGMIQPIVVREIEEGSYELIAGERRWRAAEKLGWETIPAIIRGMTDTEIASVALIENLQREELTVIEEASAYNSLLELHSLTQEALAQRLGKNQSTIANKIRLLKLPEQVQTAIMDKQITERHARALSKVDDPDRQIQVLEHVLEKELNVKQTEEYVQAQNQPVEKPKSAEKQPKRKGVSKDIRIAMNTIRQSLDMVSDTGIDVETDEEDMDDFYQITIKIPKKK